MKTIIIGAIAAATYTGITSASTMSIDFDVYDNSLIAGGESWITIQFKNVPRSSGSAIRMRVDAADLPSDKVIDNVVFFSDANIAAMGGGATSAPLIAQHSSVTYYGGITKHTISTDNTTVMQSTGSFFDYLFVFADDDVTPAMFLDTFAPIEPGADEIMEIDIHDFNGYTPDHTDTWLIDDGYSASYRQLHHSNAPIPEPSISMLAALSVAGLLMNRRR